MSVELTETDQLLNSHNSKKKLQLIGCEPTLAILEMCKCKQPSPLLLMHTHSQFVSR